MACRCFLPCKSLRQLWSCADVLSITIWLVPARKENIAVNVPPYLNAETTVLQDINDTGYFQASTHTIGAYPLCAPCLNSTAAAVVDVCC